MILDRKAGKGSEKLRAFQRNVLHAILLAGALFTAAFVGVDWLDWNHLGDSQLAATEIACAVALVLLGLSRRYPRSYLPIAVLTSAVSFLLFTSALFLVPNDELRAVWFLVGLGLSYILLGRLAGILYSAASIALILGANPTLPTPFSTNAMVTIVLALAWCSVFFYVHTTHAIALYRRLIDSESHFRMLTEDISEVVWRQDSRRHITYISPSDQRLRGFQASEVIGRHVFSTLSEEGVAIMSTAMQQAKTSVTVPMRCKDGRVLWFELTSTQELDENGEVSGYHGVSRDVSERMLAEAELARYRNHLEALVGERTAALSIAKEAAEAANRAKSIFLANVSHELRTPLTVIMGMTEVAQCVSSDPDVLDPLARAMVSSRQLLSLINNLIDIADIEAQRLSLAPVVFDIALVHASVERLFAHQAAAKGLSLSIDIAPELAPASFQGDPVRLMQILLNLIDNAVKFTERGTVAVRARLLEETADDVLLRFAVEDSGIGIAPEDQQRQFSLFEQGDGSSTRKYGGTGLGLALSRQLVGLMGGAIGVDSRVGKGSTFWFTARLGKTAALPGRLSARDSAQAA